LKIQEGNGTAKCVKAPIAKRLIKEDELVITHTSNQDKEVGEGFELVLLAAPKG
jgi:hypothetical protein